MVQFGYFGKEERKKVMYEVEKMLFIYASILR